MEGAATSLCAGIYQGENAFAGSPKVLELFRSNRVLKAGHLHWAVPGSAPHSARRVFSDSPLTVQMVRIMLVTDALLTACSSGSIVCLTCHACLARNMTCKYVLRFLKNQQ